LDDGVARAELASPLHEDRVVPTVHDVRGAPVPGLSGVLGRPAPGGLSFRDVLERLAPARAPAARLGPGRILPAPRPIRPGSLRPSRSAFIRPALAAPDAKAVLATAIRTAAGRAGVEPALSVAVARAESNLDPRARSSDGLSVGTFQMTAATAAEMRRKIAARTVARPPGSDDVALGVGYLRYLNDLFGRSARLAPGLTTVPVENAERRLFAVAAFNAGEGRVARAQARAAANGGDPTRFADVSPYLPAITQRYVPRVLKYASEELPAATTV
jgi:soluble lytic murein transglycosylase-like protein